MLNQHLYDRFLGNLRINGILTKSEERLERRNELFVGFVRVWLSSLARAANLARRVRKPLGLAAAVGVAIGLGCFWAGPAVAAAVSGLAGFAASLTASALGAVRRTLAYGSAPQA